MTVYPPGAGSASYAGLVGDSTAAQLAPALAEQLRRHGTGLVDATVGGCQVTDLVVTFESEEHFARHPYCRGDVVEKQKRLTFRFRPGVVVFCTSMEWSGIKTGGRVVAAGSPEWERMELAAWDRVLDRLGDAAIVLILPTWWADYPEDTPPSYPVGRQRALYRAWAERHPGRVTVVDLAPVLCPSGPPCHQSVDGVPLRSDPIHYTPEGIRRVTAKLMADAPVLAEGATPAAAAHEG